MASGFFIDTNVLLYAKDPTVPAKRARAQKWLAALAGNNVAVISPQVVNEFAHNVIKKLPQVSIAELKRDIKLMQAWCTAPLEPQITLQGLDVHRRFQLSFYDSLLIASALAQGCDYFVSEDLTHDQRIFSMRIIDPFEADPESLLASH
jgi:predicted nucleic acid-binding protein